MFINGEVGVQITGPVEARSLVSLGIITDSELREERLSRLKIGFRFDEIYAIILHSYSVAFERNFKAKNISKSRKSLNILKKGLNRNKE